MRKSKSTATMLAFLGGIFGAHKFYLGDSGKGIFYIMIAIMTAGFFPISILLGVLDAVRLFMMSTERFNAQYNKGTSRRRTVSKNHGSRNQSRSERDMQMERERYKHKQQTKNARANPFLKSAKRKYKDYDLEGAIADYEQAAEISKLDKNIHYDMAGIYSILENKEKSFYHLEEAINSGFKNYEKIKTDDEFAFLRIQEEFDHFVANDFKMQRRKTIAPPKDDLLQDDLLLAQLNKLKELRSRGMLSEKEFLFEKEKIMRR